MWLVSFVAQSEICSRCHSKANGIQTEVKRGKVTIRHTSLTHVYTSGAVRKCRLFIQFVSFTFVGGGGSQEFQSQKIISDIYTCTAYKQGICMLGAPTSTSYVHFEMVENVCIQNPKLTSRTLPVW